MQDRFIIGVDMGGTYIKFGRFGADRTVLEKWKIKTPEKKEEELVYSIVDEMRQNLNKNGIMEEQLLGAGIGVPGTVSNDGIVIHAPNIGWRMTDIKRIWNRYCQIPVFAANDANTAALGEYHCGSGKGYSSMVFVTLGTGVGAGVIQDGKMLTGVHGAAGELGHMPVNIEENEPCSCGKRGCLEQYASANGVVCMLKKILKYSDMPSKLRNLADITAKELFEAAGCGDKAAVAAAEEFGKAMGRALACTAAVIDPEVFVIGGGMSEAGSILLDYIGKYYQQYVFTPSQGAKFVLASLGNEAGIHGAARLVMDKKDINKVY